MPGYLVMVRKLRHVSYLVDVGDGQLWKRHVDHMKSLSPTEVKLLPPSPPDRDTTVNEEIRES